MATNLMNLHVQEMNVRPDFASDFAWQRRFIPELKRIIGEHLIIEAPAIEDAERNTDLIVLRLEAIRIACRVREFKYLADYGNEFTLRSMRPSGVKTELAKIIEGWGNYLLYGFADIAELRLAAWVLGDLNVFRLWFNSHMAKHSGQQPGILKINGDGSSSFRAFQIRMLPPEFIVHRKYWTSKLDDLPLFDWNPTYPEN